MWKISALTLFGGLGAAAFGGGGGEGIDLMLARALAFLALFVALFVLGIALGQRLSTRELVA